MTKVTFRTFGKLFGLIALALGLVAGFNTPAAAATCVPNVVEYQPNVLLIQCAPTNYVAYTTAQGNCPVQTIDTLRMWLTLSQAGLLAGKSLNIYTTTCGSPAREAITAIDLAR